MTKHKPGPGWVNISLGGPVWEHVSGVRIHVQGLAGLGVEFRLDRNPRILTRRSE